MFLKEITITAFNYGNAGRYANGPGICLYNFVEILKLFGIKTNIFTVMPSTYGKVKNIADTQSLRAAIVRSDLIHHWSGISIDASLAIKFANRSNKDVIIGPNVLDGVNYPEEQYFLSGIQFKTFLTVNHRLKLKMSKLHHIPLEKTGILRVGPDFKLWHPVPEDNGKILWKGNSKHYVKDIDFALEVQKRLPQYEMDFMGYPQPYDYFAHVEEAKKYHLYFSSSMSETMSLTNLEQMCAGVPTITHPKIHLYNQNYVSGIITNRDVDSYCQAIEEVMENSDLHQMLRAGARKFVLDNFSPQKIMEQYRLE